MTIPSLKIVFAGTPIFAAVALESLVHSDHQVVAVYTQPDRPSGRGLKVTPSPVKEKALLYQLPVYQPTTLKSAYEEERLAGFHADVMVVAAYAMLLPAPVLRIPRLGCINIHPSLLPRWRGAAPIQRTVFAGDTITGVSIMQMDQGLDTGPVLLQRQYVLDPEETSQTLHDKMANLGADALIETLNLLAQKNIEAKVQDSTQATYAHKISKEEALIDWMRPAEELACEVRAFNPWPVAYTSWKGQNLRIWKAKVIAKDHQAEPRTIVHAGRDGIDIATGTGVLRLLEVQLPGGKILPIADFYNAKHHDLIVGQHFI